ncbi:hypothetical protein DLJ98_01550 [Haemophilus influenzae]|nr:hypothetical protein DLJ98_01550 [Haemophilus influenzae]
MQADTARDEQILLKQVLNQPVIKQTPLAMKQTAPMQLLVMKQILLKQVLNQPVIKQTPLAMKQIQLEMKQTLLKQVLNQLVISKHRSR